MYEPKDPKNDLGGLLKQAAAGDRYGELIAEMKNLVSRSLLASTRKMFSAAERVIRVMPEEGIFSADVCADAHRKLQSSRSVLGNAYLRLIKDSMKPLNSMAAVSTEECPDSHRVDPRITEAITGIKMNAIDACGDSGEQLEARLEYLEISTDACFDKEVLSPGNLCQVFLRSLQGSGFEEAHCLVMLHLYDRTINTELVDLYQSLNEMLIAADILPDLIIGGLHKDQGRAVEVRTANYYDPQENCAQGVMIRSESEKAFLIRQCMNGDMTFSSESEGLPESFKRAPSYDDAEGRNRHSSKDVVVALSELQQELDQQDEQDLDATLRFEAVNIERIKTSLFDSMNSEQDGKRVNLLDERSIDFVGMMFDAIANDDSISSLIKTQIMRLQISVIKVSISDKTLFEDPQHPVRRVLDLIASVGEDIDDADDQDYVKLAKVISRLLKEYYLDIASFKRAEKELIAMQSRRELERKKREQAEERRIIREHARNVVATELKCLSAGKTIPVIAKPLVLKYLPTLMMNQYVSHGRESEQWAASTSLLTQLIRCVQPLKTNDDWLYLKENSALLVARLHTTLARANQDEQTISEHLGELDSLFRDAILDFGFSIEEEAVPADHLSDIIDEVVELEPDAVYGDDFDITATEHIDVGAIEPDPLQDELSIARAKIEALPEEVHPGVWFELYMGEEHIVRRLKLSVILNDTASIVFTDRRGNKVVEKDAADLCDEISSNRSRMIADHSTFDNALGAVISALVA